jgi:hypothetical protein
MDKLFLSADALLRDSIELAKRIAVQEVLEYHSIHADHIAIRTSSYTAIGAEAKTVRVHALQSAHVVEHIDEQKYEHDLEKRETDPATLQVQRSRYIELERGTRQSAKRIRARREMNDAQTPRNRSRDENADQHRRPDPFCLQHGDHQQAQQE